MRCGRAANLLTRRGLLSPLREHAVAQDRQGVTDAFTSARVKSVVQRRGIRLISYGDLHREHMSFNPDTGHSLVIDFGASRMNEAVDPRACPNAQRQCPTISSGSINLPKPSKPDAIRPTVGPAI